MANGLMNLIREESKCVIYLRPYFEPYDFCCCRPAVGLMVSALFSDISFNINETTALPSWVRMAPISLRFENHRWCKQTYRNGFLCTWDATIAWHWHLLTGDNLQCLRGAIKRFPRFTTEARRMDELNRSWKPADYESGQIIKSLAICLN